jgi:uncharacterized protein (DUF885 family)
MLNRRALLASATAAATFASFSTARSTDAPATPLNALLDAFFQENLRANPERATQMGLDRGANADLRTRLTDQSFAAVKDRRARTQDQLRRLNAIDRAGLTGADRVSYDTVYYTLDSAAALQAFDFGGGSSPYVISQQTGAYQSVPDFLDTKHRIADAGDADAYLERLAAFAGQMDDETARLKHDAGLGIVPPDFILDLTLAQMTAVQQPADQSLLVTSITKRAAAKGLSDTYGGKAAGIYEGQVLPALARQIEVVRHLRANASHEAGVGRFKQGPAYYAAVLKASTTVSLSPAEIHQLGLDQAREISGRLDGLLKAQGLTKGTVAERIHALYQDPASFYPNTDAGKVQAIAYCNDRLAAIRPRLPTAFKRVPSYSFEVRRVPVATELGSATAFSEAPALDGSRPGIVYINLHDSAEWPRWSLPTVIYHEGLPGHQLEGGLALSNKNLPLIRKSGQFSGYAEGWALYAEQLADEIGMYDDDPLGRIGYLRFQLFRAGRCVTDTGIHHMGWSREQAIQYFVDLEADAPGFAAREVERYCVNPGQACSYKLGHTVFVNQRARAKAALGARYDIKDFHEAALGCGRVPLDVLETVIGDWLKEVA